MSWGTVPGCRHRCWLFTVPAISGHSAPHLEFIQSGQARKTCGQAKALHLRAFAWLYLFRVVQLALVANREHAHDIKVGDEPIQGYVAALAEGDHELSNLTRDAPPDQRVSREG